MKRLVAFILLVFIVTAIPAMAESKVALPGGLEFGMSLDVAASTSGFHKISASSRWLAYIDATGFNNTEYLYSDATIGGLDAQACFYFHDSGLKQAEYELTEYYEEDDIAQAACEEIAAAMTDKYGEPVDKDSSSHQFSPVATYSCVDTTGEYNYFNQSGYTWIINDDDGSTYIDVYPRKLIGLIIGELVNTTSVVITYTHYDFQVDETTDKSKAIDF